MNWGFWAGIKIKINTICPPPYLKLFMWYNLCYQYGKFVTWPNVLFSNGLKKKMLVSVIVSVTAYIIYEGHGPGSFSHVLYKNLMRPQTEMYSDTAVVLILWFVTPFGDRMTLSQGLPKTIGKHRHLHHHL